jgi:aerobic carbon-monoxide dehydrogenase medium subunit
MIPTGFDYVRATSVDEAIAALGDPGTKVIAGGQSLLPVLKMRLAQVDRLVDIGRLTELKGVRDLPDGGLEIGALTTYAELIAAAKLSWTNEALEHIADPQTRNRGTVGGAISHADPALELPALGLALDYSAVLRSSRGERIVPLDGFFLGAFQTALEPDELLVALRRGPLPAGAGGAYRSIEQAASGYAIVGVAAVLGHRHGVLGSTEIDHVRVAITGVADAPYRARAVEEALVGTDCSPDRIVAAALKATEGVTVNGDIHAGAAYRTAMAAVVTRRALEAARARSS